jgi:hypothetical protein
LDEVEPTHGFGEMNWLIIFLKSAKEIVIAKVIAMET